MKLRFDLEATGFSLVNARSCAVAAQAAYLGKLKVKSEKLKIAEGERELPANEPVRVNCSSSPLPSPPCGMEERRTEARGEFVECGATSTQALVLDCGAAVVVAFRGTQEALDFVTDAEAWRLNLAGCTVHFGFWKAMMSVFQPVCEAIERVANGGAGKGTGTLREGGGTTVVSVPSADASLGDGDIAARFPYQRKPLFVTGHSLGGALAMLFAYRYVAVGRWEPDGDRGAAFAGLRRAKRGRGDEVAAEQSSFAKASEDRCSALRVYTFGQPRVGDGNFARLYNRFHGKQTFRVVNDQDIVPRVPGVLLGYRHCGNEALLSAECGVRSAELLEELKIPEAGCGVTLNPRVGVKLLRDAWFLWRARRKGPLALAELIRDHHIESYLRRMGD